MAQKTTAQTDDKDFDSRPINSETSSPTGHKFTQLLIFESLAPEISIINASLYSGHFKFFSII